MFLLPKAIYRFTAMPIKFKKVFYPEIEKKNPKVHMKSQKTQNIQSNPEKEQS